MTKIDTSTEAIAAIIKAHDEGRPHDCKGFTALELAANESQCAAAKPLVWAQIETAPRGGEWFIARTEKGTARVVHYADEYDRFPISYDSAIWETPPIEWIPLSSILSAIPLRPEAEVRAEAWAAAIEAAADACADYPRAAPDEREWPHYDDQISHSQDCIRALTPPTDISAALNRIKAEEYARGLADGMPHGAYEDAIARAERAEIEAAFFQGEVKLRNRIPATSDAAADLLRRAERAEAALTIAEEALRGAIDAIDAAYDGPGDNGAYTVRERAALAKIKALKGGVA